MAGGGCAGSRPSAFYWPPPSPGGQGCRQQQPQCPPDLSPGSPQARVTPAHGVQNGVAQGAPEPGKGVDENLSCFIYF